MDLMPDPGGGGLMKAERVSGFRGGKRLIGKEFCLELFGAYPENTHVI